MKRAIILLLVSFSIVATPAIALAVDMNYYWWNYLQNNNAGLKGVASDFSVLQLHPGHENYRYVVSVVRGRIHHCSLHS